MPLKTSGTKKGSASKKAMKRVPSEEKSHPGKSVRTKKGKRTLKPSRRCAGHQKGTLMNWDGYQELNVIYDFLHYLELEYPAICTVIVLGQSVSGRSIKMLKISNTVETNKAVWLDATIHSREWISTCVVTFIANLIAKNFLRLPSYITNKDWYIIPVLNPDGYRYTQTTRLWRKNLAKHKKEIVGVDLNRNFSYKWGINEDEGSSSLDPHNSRYRGPKPFSEPESAAVKNFISKSEKQFDVFLNFHSPDQAITIPWCYTTEPCPDYIKLMQGGAVMSKAIFKATGRIYKVGTFRDMIYSAAGTSLDWSYGSAKIPFSYLIELRKGQQRFILPKTQIIDTCKETTAAVFALMKFVDNCKKQENELKSIEDSQKKKLESEKTNVLIPASDKPSSSKTVQTVLNIPVNGLANPTELLVLYCNDIEKTYLNKTSIVTALSINEWRVEFADNNYAKAILNRKCLSKQVTKPCGVQQKKEKRNVKKYSNAKNESSPGVRRQQQHKK